MRDAYEKFREHGIELYAISYDDQRVLSEFASKQNIPFRLLSDVDSSVIRAYGILNEQVTEEAGPIFGIPYPGVYVTDEDGVVVAKFFHDTYKKRDSPEILIDAAMGRPVIAPDAPRCEGDDENVRVSVAFHGGRSTLRQGVIRNVVVHVELENGLHVYGEPVPQGMTPFRVDVSGPPGLVAQAASAPPSEILYLESVGMELPVIGQSFDVIVPVYATGELASETRPLDQDRVEIQVRVQYQACNADVCHLPKTETFPFQIELDVIDVPRLGMHLGHGQRAGQFDATPHMLRLMWRKFRGSPLNLFRFLRMSWKLEREARRRRRAAGEP